MTYFTHINKEKLVEIFETHKLKHGEYPTTNEIKKLKNIHKEIIPSPRWIQNNGGLSLFYNSLGINYVDARTGFRRSMIAMQSNKKAQSLDVNFSESLIKKYGERNVHWQSPYNKGKTLHRSDFRIYKNKHDFFFVDLFFPKDIESLIGCVNTKINKIALAKVHEPIYLICCNELDVSAYQIDQYIKSRKKSILDNIKLLHISDARLLFFK